MQRYLYFTVFFSGMTALAVELSASRLLGNVFGTSNLVWAAIIGLMLLYLTVGYFIGGRWADRSPNYLTFFGILAWSAFLVGLVPVISRPVLRISAQAFDQLEFSILAGSFISILILFSIPVTLLGMISPFAIRLAITDPEKAGRTSGYIYAVSTLGSIVGTFLPVLVLIPSIGTYRTFIVFSGVLLLVALLGLWINLRWRGIRFYIWMPVTLVFLAWLGLTGPQKATAGQVYETESAYNYIEVIEQDGYRYLRLNEGQGVHSVYHPEVLDHSGPWEQVLAAPFFYPAPYSPNQVESLAIVGLAAGTTARQATAVFGPIPIDGFEIDPIIIQVGREYFNMVESNLTTYAQDGRWGLEQSSHRYQIISVDAYRPPYIPWHLTTKEFFETAYEKLTDEGVLVINIGRGPNDRRLIEALATTISTVFPSVHIMDLPDTFNSILYATVQPTSPANLAENLAILKETHDTHPLLIRVIETTLVNLQPPPPSTMVFTDDLAPVEWITNDMVLSYILSGDVEELK